MIHAYASLSHYADHLAPILDAVPEAERGEVWSPSERKPWGLPIGSMPPLGTWMVAGYADAVRMAHHGPLIYVEHGAGQTYGGDPRSVGHGAFSGGDGLDHVGLFVCPREEVAARWRARYPHARAVAVGCPKMDAWMRWPRVRPSRTGEPIYRGDHRPVVAVTFHHENAQIPEQQSARTFLRDALPGLRDHVESLGGQLLGHGHPRNWSNIRDLWRRLGVPCTDDLGEVFDLADVLVADNTSAAYEFASLGRPVVWVSPPWYRRDVTHGQRFWRDIEGLPHVQDPSELVPMVDRAIFDPSSDTDARVAMVARTYAFTDGRSSARAAQAIVEYTSGVQ